MFPSIICLIAFAIAFILIAWKKHKMRTATLPISNLEPNQNFNNSSHNKNMVNGTKLMIVVMFLILILVPQLLSVYDIIENSIYITLNLFYIPSIVLPYTIIILNKKYFRYAISLCYINVM